MLIIWVKYHKGEGIPQQIWLFNVYGKKATIACYTTVKQIIQFFLIIYLLNFDVILYFIEQV